jgi:hypothetical protein
MTHSAAANHVTRKRSRIEIERGRIESVERKENRDKENS